MKRLPVVIGETLEELDVTGHKVALTAGWDPAFMSKVLRNQYPLGPKRLVKLLDTLETFGLTLDHRIRVTAAFAVDRGLKPDSAMGACQCDLCARVQQYMPGFGQSKRQAGNKSSYRASGRAA